MKKTTLTFILCFWASAVWPIEYYLFIENRTCEERKCDEIDFEKGDVVHIAVKNENNRPTRSEYENYKILIVDLGDEDFHKYISPKKDQNNDIQKKRDKKIDNVFIEQKVDDERIKKSDFINNIIDK